MYVKREIEEKIEKWLDEREIIAIRGSRQCGKTTILNRIKEILISRGVKDNCINYIDFEDNIIRMKFEENPKEFISSYLTKEKCYFLLDEVQYVKNIGKNLKLIFDSFANIKIIITGSSSFDLTTLGKYLVGRILFFDIYPFSFLEFLRAKGERYEKIYNEIKIDLSNPALKNTLFLDELNTLLHEYLTFGAYPRIVLEEDRVKKKELLKNLFITYVEKDVVSLYGNKYRDGTVKLLKSLSTMQGGIVKYETLAENTGLKYHEIREIMSLLQDSFVISIVQPFYKNLVTELRKNPKIYFVDYGLRNYLAGSFDNLSYDSLYENYVYNELHQKFKVKYWRTTAKTEVDFVIDERDIIPLEVKSTPKITRAFRSFISTYHPKFAFIVNIKETGKEKIDECSIFIIPFVYL